MMGWGWDGGAGWAMFGMVHMLLWPILIILAIVVLAKWAFGARRDRSEEDRAIAILRERYARGEIGKEEFDARKRDLGG